MKKILNLTALVLGSSLILAGCASGGCATGSCPLTRPATPLTAPVAVVPTSSQATTTYSNYTTARY